MALDLTQRVRTKSGLAVTLLSTGLNNAKAIGGILTAPDGSQTLQQWTAEGFKVDASNPDPLDLENLDGPTAGFVNVYGTGPFTLEYFNTKSEAEIGIKPNRRARVFFRFRPGQLDG